MDVSWIYSRQRIGELRFGGRVRCHRTVYIVLAGTCMLLNDVGDECILTSFSSFLEYVRTGVTLREQVRFRSLTLN